MDDKTKIELNKYISQYQEIQKNIDMIQTQKNMLLSNINNIDSSIKSINTLSNNNNDELIDLMIPIGSDCFINSKVKRLDSKILVNIGSGIAILKSDSDTIKYLNDKKESFEKVISDINNTLEKMSSNLYSIEYKINELNNK